MPYMVESQKLHIWQVKQKAIEAHKAHMKALDDWMANLENELNRYRRNKELDSLLGRVNDGNRHCEMD